MNFRKNVLWLDGLAGLTVGILMFLMLLAGLLSQWHGLPRELLLLLASVNVAYGLYSTSLARRAQRPMRLIVMLVIANLVWAVVCLCLFVTYQATATWLGLAQLATEGALCAGLACLEWRWREILQIP